LAVPTNNSIVSNQISLQNIWEYAVNEQYAIALWRQPKESSLHFLADFSGKPQAHKIDFESNITGFAISPFLNPNGQESLILKNDLHLEFDVENQYLSTENEQVNTSIFLEKVYSYSKQNTKKSHKIDLVTTQNDREKFEKIVEQAIDKIQNGHFQKVVLSRKKSIEFKGELALIDLVNKLTLAYPNAFISAVYLPQQNVIWLGASPELLVSYDENGIFKTMALAGTQNGIDANGQKIGPANARWSQKEIEEQAFVSRYIIECFKKVRVREYIENGPKTVEAGNLLHLQTTYMVDTQAINFSQFATIMLELLHPTSAVCGMPKAETEQFIQENEAYDREFYSGFLGPLNINNASSLYVNLRSLKIDHSQIMLFAGAGITEDSQPQKEYDETEMKMETLLRIING
jgi:isochorismate synthase